MRVITATVCLIAVSMSTYAEDTPPAPPPLSGSPCFELSVPTNPRSQIEAMLLNKCTGQTWQLVRGGGPNRTFVYRWHPIGVDANPAQLSYPQPANPDAPAPRPKAK